MPDRRPFPPVRRAPLLLALAAVALAGCSALLGCSTPPPPTFDLTAPADVPGGQPRQAQLIVSEPAAVQVLDSDRVLVHGRDGQVSYLGGAAWADRLPRLVQTRLVQTFENDHRLTAVGRPEDRLTADATLISELRDFQIDAASGQAVVTVSAKVVDNGTGRIRAAQIFRGAQPAGGAQGPAATRALDAALQGVLRDIVVWTDEKV